MLREAAKKTASTSRIEIPYSANTTDVQSQVLQLKEKKPDVVIFVSYTSDAILYAKTMKALDYKPPMLIGDNAGFSDASFLSRRRRHRAGRDQPLVLGHRQARHRHVPDQRDVQEEDAASTWTTRRAAPCRACSTLAEAINRAGSTEPAKIQAALKATDLKPNQLMIGYNGVKFDEKGNNVLASSADHPDAGRRVRGGLAEGRAATASCKLPYKGW